MRALKLLCVGLILTTLPALVSCKGSGALIQKATVKVSEDFQTVRVGLVFGTRIQATYTGAFDLADYGSVFIQGYTAETPMEVGFDLNTAIMNDQDYVALTPTMFLPNGNPIGVPHPIVEVRGKQPINDQFDLYGYVDVLKAQWLGAAALFSFLTNEYFPPGLSVSQSFLTNAQGAPGVLASVFGPTLNPDGTLSKAGGIALFANVKQLLGQAMAGKLPVGRAVDLREASNLRVTVRDGRPVDSRLLRLEEALIRGFNTHGRL